MVNVSIITVGMNHLRFIRNLYHTLLTEHRPKVSFEVIYVDNCSQDGSVEWVKENCPEVKIIQNDKIRGFGENNNIGVMASTGRYIAIINPDIEFLDDAIDKLYQYAEKCHGQFGILAPKLLNPDGTVQYSARHFITLKIFVNRAVSHGNDKTHNSSVGSYLCKDMDTSKTQPVNWVMGAAMFMRRDFFLRLGGFDLSYFLYMEDEDLCLRSWKEGQQVIYLGDVAVVHNHLKGSRKVGKKMLIHFHSLFTFFMKHGWNIQNPVINEKITT